MKNILLLTLVGCVWVSVFAASERVDAQSPSAVEQLVANGKLAEAEKLVKSSREVGTVLYWTDMLGVADGYYAATKYKDTQRLYDEFFKQQPLGPSAEMKDVYLEKAYQYAQLLLLSKEKKKALDVYELLLLAKPSRHIDRQVRGEMVELLVRLAQDAQDKSEQKPYIAQVKKHGAKLLWVQDLWFGKGIAALAHVKQIEGDNEGAMKLLNDYMPQVKQIDKAMTDALGEGMGHLSPLPECRYVLAMIMLERAEDLIAKKGDDDSIKLLLAGVTKDGKKSTGALQHFVNVSVRYPKSAWAADAKKKAAQIQELLKRHYNATISVGAK